MTHHDHPGALRPEVLAARIFAGLVARLTRSDEAVSNELLAEWACDATAAFLREWRTRDPLTALPNGLPADVETEAAGDRA